MLRHRSAMMLVRRYRPEVLDRPADRRRTREDLSMAGLLPDATPGDATGIARPRFSRTTAAVVGADPDVRREWASVNLGRAQGPTFRPKSIKIHRYFFRIINFMDG